MKKNILLLLALFTILTIGCEDSTSEEFEIINPDVTEQFIKSIIVVSAQDSSENKNIILSYDGDGRLSSVTDGIDNNIFVYDNDNGDLVTITGDNDNLSIEELFESPYDAFETGEVLEYDNNGNPFIVTFLEEVYNEEIFEYETKEFTATITYDDKPNPYFFTLEAGGLIEVLDQVQFNFSIPPLPPEILQARALFPLNNPSKIIYKNEENVIVYEMNADYVYNEFNFPTSVTVTILSLDDNQTNVYTANYSYL